MERYYQKEIECASQEQIRSWQDERLVRQVRHVWDNVPYYRAKMEAAHIAPDDIKSRDDLYKLPFLSKADLREAYPFGLLAEPLEKCIRIHSTSGTTGKRVVAFYTKEDIDLWNDCCARALAAAGAGPEDVCQVAYGYGLFTGGFGLNGGSQKLGCLTLPMSSGNTDRQLQFMEDLGSTVLCCTPSYAAYLAEIYRGGINSVDKGQHEAAFALGLSKKQTMLDIILPQTMKAVLPPIVNEAITLVKDTALASALPMVELMKATNSAVNRMTDITPMLFAALLYLLINLVLTMFAGRLEKYFARYDRKEEY